MSASTPQPPIMSSTTVPPPQPVPAAPRPMVPRREIMIYGHTMLFYYWPLWFFGYLFAFFTYWSDYRMVIVPGQTSYQVVSKGDKTQGQIMVQNNTGETVLDENNSAIQGGRFLERASPHNSLGVVYVFIMMITILITTVPLRGIASLVAIVTIALIVVSFSYLGWWDDILNFLGRLRVHMSAGFYVFFSTVLLVVWLVVFFGYDRMNYWRITPGQIAHRYVFGGGERTFDTEGMAFSKLRDDLFRHLILGLGSGDLVMDPLKSGGAEKDDLSIHNVLFIGHKLRLIDDLISQKPNV